MLQDNALKFYRDHTYIIPHKPIENGQYMNKMAYWRQFGKFTKIWMEITCFISKTVSDRAKQSLFSTPVDLLTTKLQLLKIFILGHMTPQGHMTSEM